MTNMKRIFCHQLNLHRRWPVEVCSIQLESDQRRPHSLQLRQTVEEETREARCRRSTGHNPQWVYRRPHCSPVNTVPNWLQRQTVLEEAVDRIHCLDIRRLHQQLFVALVAEKGRRTSCESLDAIRNCLVPELCVFESYRWAFFWTVVCIVSLTETWNCTLHYVELWQHSFPKPIRFWDYKHYGAMTWLWAMFLILHECMITKEYLKWRVLWWTFQLTLFFGFNFFSWEFLWSRDKITPDVKNILLV